MTHEFVVPVQIGDEDVNNPYHHVHHARALYFLEFARAEYLKSRGLPLEEFYKRGVLIVLSDLQVRYMRELRKELISVTVKNVLLERKRIHMIQRILNGR